MIRAISRLRYAKMGTAAFSSNSNHYDMITIGGGSGGLFTALKAKSYGKKVAIIDKHKLGGRCVHAGCIPKKLIFNATMILEDIHHGPDYGVTCQNPKIDWLQIKKMREAHVQGMHEEYLRDCNKAGVEVIPGFAKFTAPHELEVTMNNSNEKKKITADHIVVATGSRPLMPNIINGISCCINTDSFFALEKMPKNIFIIGGGYIGVELACAINSFGIKTGLCMLEENIVTPFDKEVSDILADY